MSDTQLFKVELLDPRITHGRQRRDVYVVAACSADTALNRLHAEHPSAFVYNPKVNVAPWSGQTVHLSATTVNSSTPKKEQS